MDEDLVEELMKTNFGPLDWASYNSPYDSCPWEWPNLGGIWAALPYLAGPEPLRMYGENDSQPISRCQLSPALSWSLRISGVSVQV